MQSTGQLQQAKRLAEPDIMRGVFVLGMIIAHVCFHLSTWTIPESLILWIPIGFVFATGYLLSKVHLQRKSSRSIQWRGVKLLLIFALLNLPRWLGSNLTVANVLHQMIVPNHTAFEILFPIGLTIICAPLWYRLPQWLQWTVALGGLLLIDSSQYAAYVPKFLLIGLFAITIAKHSGTLLITSKAKALASCIVCIVLFVAVQYLPTSYLLHTCIVVLGWLWITSLIQTSSKVTQLMMHTGAYSLWLYITHVFLIIGLAHITVKSDSSLVLFLNTIKVLGACLALTFLLHKNRSIKLVDRVYKVIFQ